MYDGSGGGARAPRTLTERSAFKNKYLRIESTRRSFHGYIIPANTGETVKFAYRATLYVSTWFGVFKIPRKELDDE
jgi:hypothetical protein